MALRCPSIALLVLAAFLSFASAARAADDRVFVERDVPAQATAADAVQARENAIAEAQVLALRRLMERLSPPESRGRLPAVPASQIDRYVRSFEVQSEQVGSTTYQALITVRFQPDAVQALMDQSGVGYAVISTRPTLVLAFWQGELASELNAAAEPWRQALTEAAGRSTSMDPIQPLGDAEDLAVPAGAASAGDPGVLVPMASRYGAAAVLVADAAPTAGGLVVKSSLVGTDGTVKRLVSTTLPAGADGGLPLAQAAAAIVDGADGSALQAAIPSNAPVSTLPVLVPLADLTGWIQIKQALEATPEIRTVTVKRFSRQEAGLQLDYVGDLERLRSALQTRAIVMDQEMDGWRLRRAGDVPMSTNGG